MRSSSLSILIYHPVLLPVLEYGGTERVLMWLALTLQKKGHQVAVFAAAGSRMPWGIECITDDKQLLLKAKNFDVLHAFTKISPELESAMNGRVMVTIHGNGQTGETFHRNTSFLSRDHATRHGATAFVYNGIDVAELGYDDQVRPNRYLYLSKTSLRVKNARGAARLAATAKQNLWIAGGNRPYVLRAQVAWQKLKGRDWNWVGSVNQAHKKKFLLAGRATIFPVLWNEPFGLVVVESLASGTPVLANAYGSLPELLAFAPQCLMNSKEDWAAALRGEVKLPSPKMCRDWVLENFTQEKMTENYIKLYEKVIAGEFLNAEIPQTKISAEELSCAHE